jgi:hypothetical protein
MGASVELRRRSKLADGIAAIAANWLTLAIIFLLNTGLVFAAYLLRSERRAVPKVDLVVVFDTTSSMMEEIWGMVRASRDLAAELAMTGSDYRIGALCFGEELRETHPMTDDAEQIRSFFAGLDAWGGGDEDFVHAGMTVLRTMDWRSDAKRFLVFITDEPYRRPSAAGESFGDLRTAVRGTAATVYVAAIPEVPDYRTLAEESGGKFYDIHSTTHFDLIILAIGENIAKSLSQ